MSEPKITGDLSSLSDRNKLLADLWNENRPRAFYFVVGDKIEKRQGQPTQLGCSWDGDEDTLEITITSISDPLLRMVGPRGDQMEGTLFDDVFLTEKEAIEAILPWLRERANWYFNVSGVYTDRLEEIS